MLMLMLMEETQKKNPERKKGKWRNGEMFNGQYSVEANAENSYES